MSVCDQSCERKFCCQAHIPAPDFSTRLGVSAHVHAWPGLTSSCPLNVCRCFNDVVHSARRDLKQWTRACARLLQQQQRPAGSPQSVRDVQQPMPSLQFQRGHGCWRRAAAGACGPCGEGKATGVELPRGPPGCHGHPHGLELREKVATRRPRLRALRSARSWRPGALPAGGGAWPASDGARGRGRSTQAARAAAQRQ